MVSFAIEFQYFSDFFKLLSGTYTFIPSNFSSTGSFIFISKGVDSRIKIVLSEALLPKFCSRLDLNFDFIDCATKFNGSYLTKKSPT